MTQPGSYLAQSKYYSPSFNSAIFDGPIRLYFAQAQEAEALKLYFRLQEQMKDHHQDTLEDCKRSGRNIFVMLYPTSETFEMSFDDSQSDNEVVLAKLSDDYILGIRGPLNSEEYDVVLQGLSEVVEDLQLNIKGARPLIEGPTL